MANGAEERAAAQIEHLDKKIKELDDDVSMRKGRRERDLRAVHAIIWLNLLFCLYYAARLSCDHLSELFVAATAPEEEAKCLGQTCQFFRYFVVIKLLPWIFRCAGLCMSARLHENNGDDVHTYSRVYLHCV